MPETDPELRRLLAEEAAIEQHAAAPQVMWALRSSGNSILLMRCYKPALRRTRIWADVATFHNINDAEQVLRILEQAATG